MDPIKISRALRKQIQKQIKKEKRNACNLHRDDYIGVEVPARE
jgi:hypothetical protein